MNDIDWMSIIFDLVQIGRMRCDNSSCVNNLARITCKIWIIQSVCMFIII